jgi:hypothetical protein
MGLGTESLPDFLQALAGACGDKANTRMFAERYRVTHYPKNGVQQHDFIWSTQLIKDLRSLAFSRDDLAASYSNQFRSLSVFSLAPLSEANMMAGNAIRQRMLQFEATKGNHSPVEAAEMAKLSVLWSSMPGNRHETVEWVEHVSLMTEMIVGEACPVNPYLNRILFNLGRPQLFVGWMEGDWKALIWSLHVAHQTFMAEQSIHPLSFLSSEI